MRFITKFILAGSLIIGFFGILILISNLFGVSYIVPNNEACIDCYSAVYINSSIWSMKAVHAGNKPKIFSMFGLVRGLNIDKINEIVETDPIIPIELMIPTDELTATIDHPNYGFLKPIEEGDYLFTAGKEDLFVIHSIPDGNVKWGVNLKDWLVEDIFFDPIWYGPSGDGTETALAGHWKFEGNFLDSSSYHKNARAQSGVVKIDTGAKGRGIKIDDANYLVVGDANHLDLNDTFSISLWVNTEYAVGQQFAVDKGGTTTGIYVRQPTSNGDFEIKIDDGTDDQYARSSTGFNDGKWHHIVGVVNNRVSMTFYVDGINDTTLGSNTASGLADVGTVTNDLILNIGSQHGGVNQFHGGIDELRIYNRTLSTAEVQALYNSSKKSYSLRLKTTPQQGLANESDLIGHWTFDAKDGSNFSSAPDISGYGNDGVVHNAILDNDGRFKEAYYFKGDNNYIDIAHNEIFNPRVHNFSLSFWFKGNSTGWNRILTKSISATSIGYRCYDGGTDYKMRWRLQGDLGYNSQTQPEVVFDNEWHHAVWVIDRNVNRTIWYFDGVQSTTIFNITGIGSINTTTALRIGAGIENSDWFNGSIDELRIYNRSLSPSEARELYNGTKSNYLRLKTTPQQGLANESKLLGHWTFDAKDGSNFSSAPDISGYGNNGTVTGATFITDSRFKEGYNFDGVNDYITMSDKDRLPYGNTSRTVSMWAKTYERDNCGSSWNCTVLFYGGAASSSIFSIGIGDQYAGMHFSSCAFFAVNINDHQWHHYIFMVKNATHASVYRDTVIIRNQSTACNISTVNDNDFTIGSGNGHFFNGSLDDIRLYNRTLSDAEIHDLYNGTKSNYFRLKSVIG